jgi:hypothetical protein
VQGSEGVALEGAAGLLALCPRVKMLVEFWPAGLARSGYGAERLLGLLQRRGFRLYEVDEGESCVRRADPRRILERYPTASEGFTNLLRAKALPGRGRRSRGPIVGRARHGTPHSSR